MGNIAITSKCNHSCSYCFAGISDSACHGDMGLSVFLKTADFLASSGVTKINIIGGEPTLHSEFKKIMEYALKRFHMVVLFTNGDMPEKSRDYLKSLSSESIMLIVNLTGCTTLSTNVAETLTVLGNLCMPGVTIYTSKVELDYLIDIILKYDLKRWIRIGIAHPGATAENCMLTPRTYQMIGRRLGDFAQNAMDANVKIKLDCGFVPCMFDSADFEFFEHTPETIGGMCGPIPDILPDGTCIPCYPCAEISRVSSGEYSKLEELKKRMIQDMLVYSQAGIFKECSECPLKLSGRCNGGCRGHAIRRLQKTEFTVEANDYRSRPVSKLDSYSCSDMSGKTWSVPYIDQPLPFWERIINLYGKSIKEVYLPLPVDGIGSGRPCQPQRHRNDFLRSGVVSVSLLINPIVLPGTVEKVTPLIIDALSKIASTTRVSSITVVNATLAQRIKEVFPHMSLTASVLMDIHSVEQLPMLGDIFDTIVISSSIVRSISRVKELRRGWNGSLRMIVNEGCLPGCVWRTQHFYEMSGGDAKPGSLCSAFLKREPWMRLTGSWVLPQHLHYYDECIDGFKLDGRVTLKNPENYAEVLKSYLLRKTMYPHQLGCGPAGVDKKIDINDNFYTMTLHCDKTCVTCDNCKSYWNFAEC